MKLTDLIELAYQEDIPSGDVTTESLQLTGVPSSAKLIAKQDLVLSGSELFSLCFLHMDPQSSVKWYFKDSEIVLSGQTVASVKASNLQMLKAERVALNFLGHLSGIATMTKYFVKATEGTSCRILDTRKTTPLYRDLEKKAVKDGGGQNHRMNLSDKIMLKENHIDLVGGLSQAVERVKSGHPQFIEVECKNLDEVQKCIDLGVDRIMLEHEQRRNDECREDDPISY
jgi:nicotinate-nucleotide pyrophosphorylase (carboxylating)